MRRSRLNSNGVARSSHSHSAPGSDAAKKGPVTEEVASVQLTVAQQRRTARHDRTLQKIARTTYRRCPRQWLRGANRQNAQRHLEHAARLRALATARWARWHGWSHGRVALHLGLDTATLADWRRRHDQGTLKPKPLGAKPLLATPDQRRDVLDFLTMHGTALGVGVLHDHFPYLARRDLCCLLQIARIETDHLAAGGYYRAVTWFRPGRAWAMDHTDPPKPIDGRYGHVLNVRDLASGCTLASVAVESEDAQSTIDVLRALIAQHGAPLVIKADNGPAFTAFDLKKFLARHRIALLLSPAYTPRYNGACEAGNGVIKFLAHRIACRHDRPESWSLDDLEAARLLANRRITAPDQSMTPEQLFSERAPISDSERLLFENAIAAARLRRLRKLIVDSEKPRHSIPADALARQAIADALSDTGVITIRSKRLRLSNPLQEVG